MKSKHSPPVTRSPRRYWPWLVALVVFPAAAAAWLVLPTSDDGMVWVPPGWFWMGSDEFEDARPVHRVWVDGFWMDRYEVTNEQFAKFVAATGYKTHAERVPHPDDLPGVAKEDLVPCSLVFTPPASCPPGECGNCDRWWKVVKGASWQHPQGPKSSIEGM